MCDHENREAAMLVVRRDENGTPTVWCDPCLAPMIEALNAGGIETTASCCGHNGKGSDGLGHSRPGWVMLRDGRTLYVAREPAPPNRPAPLANPTYREKESLMSRLLTKLSTRKCTDCSDASAHTAHLTWVGRLRFTGGAR